MFPARILLATDGSGASEPALQVAVELALGAGSELHVAHVLPTPSEKPPFARLLERRRRSASLDAARVAALALLDGKAQKVEKLGGTVAGSHYREGDPADQVALLAEELGAGVVVVGFRERGPSGPPFSSDPSEAVLRRVRCAVVVVRGPRERRG